MKLIHGRPNSVDLLIRSDDHRASPANPPRTGLRPDDVVCRLKRSGTLAWSHKELTPASWQDAGHGIYVLSLTAEDIGDAQALTVLITGSHELKQPIVPMQQMFEVVEPEWLGPTPIPETILCGRILTLDEKGKPKAQVIARVAQFPLLVGAAAITNDAITVETNDDGFFELKVVTGAIVHIQIPAIQYQKQIVVPPAPAPGIPVRLFSL
jgi:hypothetical protein